MKVYTNTNFNGYWPVGTSAVCVALNRLDAKAMLESELKKIGLEQTINEHDFNEISLLQREAYILNNGDY